MPFSARKCKDDGAMHQSILDEEPLPAKEPLPTSPASLIIYGQASAPCHAGERGAQGNEPEGQRSGQSTLGHSGAIGAIAILQGNLQGNWHENCFALPLVWEESFVDMVECEHCYSLDVE